MSLSIDEKYKKLKKEFENYQSFAESTIQMLNERNTTLEKKLDAMTNIVEISKYINSNISDANLIPMINDMIIGILGVSFSTIFLYEDKTLIPKATNKANKKALDFEFFYPELNNGEPFVMNSREPLFIQKENHIEIHSIIGVPIYIRKELRGYIIVEHFLYNFFNYDHVNFISSIANQIGIALENNSLYKIVKENSIKDPLLNIYNRKYFFDTVEEKIKENSHIKFGIVMVDIDNFKKINDMYGHQFGDIVLIETTKLIKNNMGKKDIIARYGGEEIVIFIDDIQDKQKVYNKVDYIRSEIENNLIKHREDQKKITASFGLSYFPLDGEKLEEVINIADTLLYKAKNAGKNKVVSNT